MPAETSRVYTHAGRAGATASINCSLCQAGTYGTGSGEGLRIKISFSDPYILHAALLATFSLFSPFHLSLRLGRSMLRAETFWLGVTERAGATASVNCSLCQAGTYGTGSGEGLRMEIAFALTRTSSMLLFLLHSSSLSNFISL